MIYYTHMVERGADHLKALCVVAGALAERAWAMMNRQMPYVICDIDGTPVTAEQAKRIIAQDFTVPRGGPPPEPQHPNTGPETGSADHQQQWGKAHQQAAHGGMRSDTNTRRGQWLPVAVEGGAVVVVAVGLVDGGDGTPELVYLAP
jgi:hypothetical protein